MSGSCRGRISCGPSETTSRRAADEFELLEGDPSTAVSGVLRARLRPEDARRFERRLEKLVQDFLAADAAGEPEFVFANALFPRRSDA